MVSGEEVGLDLHVAAFFFFTPSFQGSFVCFGCGDVFLEATGGVLVIHTARCPFAQDVLEADEAELLRDAEEEEEAGGLVVAGHLDESMETVNEQYSAEITDSD